MNTEQMTVTCCQDHILTENIWFVWSETSYSEDERMCHGCGTTKRRTLKIELLSQWKLEAESRKNHYKLPSKGEFSIHGSVYSLGLIGPRNKAALLSLL